MTTAAGRRRPSYKGDRHNFLYKVPVDLWAAAMKEAKRQGYEYPNDYLVALLAQAVDMPEHAPAPVKRKRRKRTDQGVLPLSA